MRILKTLHVGVGNRGHWPLDHGQPDLGFTPHALCDVNPDFLAEAQKKTGLPDSACYSDLDEALSQSGADCMVICTPTTLHESFVAKGLEAGLLVLTEKGMAPDWEGAKRMVAHKQSVGGRFAVAQNYRYMACERTLLRGVTDPTCDYFVGDVFQVVYEQIRSRPNIKTLTFPYSSVWDMSCHHFDNLRAWFGDVERVSALAYAAPWTPYPFPNNTTGHLVFKNGTRVHYIHGHDGARQGINIQFHGEKGALVCDGNKVWFNAREKEQNFRFPDPLEVPLEDGPNECGVLADFHRYATTGESVGIEAEANLETMALCAMFVQSCEKDGAWQTRSDLP